MMARTRTKRYHCPFKPFVKVLFFNKKDKSRMRGRSKGIRVPKLILTVYWSVVSVWRLCVFFAMDVAILFYDYVFAHRKEFNWKRKLSEFVQHPSPEIAVPRALAIVTGGNSGIGFESTYHLARAGVNVVIACRSMSRGSDAVKRIEARMASEPTLIRQRAGKVLCMSCDLSDLTLVKTFAKEVTELIDREKYVLKLLVANGGTMCSPFAVTPQGFEQQLAVSHIAHAWLIHAMLPVLKSHGPARVVIIASAAHWKGKIGQKLFSQYPTKEEVAAEQIKWDKYQAYRNAKLANVVWATELARRVLGHNLRYTDPCHAAPPEGGTVTINALHPGCVRSSIVAKSGMPFASLLSALGPLVQLPLEEAAAYVLQLCLSPEFDGATVNGRYYYMGYEGDVDAAAKDPKATQQLVDFTDRILTSYP